MSKSIASVEPASSPGLLERINEFLSSMTGDARPRVLTVAVFVLGASLMLMYRPFSQLEAGDSALYDYIGQSILRGQVPYRDIVDIKTPGSMYLSAFATALGQAVGLRDIVAVRLFQTLVVGLLSAITFLVARAYLRSQVAAMIAAVFPLTSHKFAEWMVVGTQPKLPMILFGMLSLLFIARDEPFWAGMTSMLSFLFWQPGLMFTGVAVLIFSKYLSSWRDGRALKALIGASLPFAIVVAYFYSRGVLADLWAWTIAYNYSVFWPEAQRPPFQALVHLWNVTSRVFAVQLVLIFMAIAAFLIALFERIRAKLTGTDGANLFGDAVLIPPIVYFAFCIIDMQAGPDLIPFIPFMGIFAGLAFVRIAKQLTRAGVPTRRWVAWIPTLALTSMLVLALGRAVVYKTVPGFTLQDQDRDFKALANMLGQEDRIYVQGPIELLVVLNRPNLNPYVLLNKGVDSFAAARRSTDFSTIIAEMESERPKLVALSRLQHVRSRDLLQGWVDEHYEKLNSFTYTNVYVRRSP